MALVVDYDKTIPATLLSEVVKYVEHAVFILPSWVNRLDVSVSPETDTSGLVMETSSMFEYRQAKIVFYPLFFHETEYNKKLAIYHEMAHAVYGMVRAESIKIINNIDAPEAFRDSLIRFIRIADEGATSDLSTLIMNFQTKIENLEKQITELTVKKKNVKKS